MCAFRLTGYEQLIFSFIVYELCVYLALVTQSNDALCSLLLSMLSAHKEWS